MTDSNNDTYDLNRFLQAQAESYSIALSELRQGHKRSHWIWYVLPQLRGLGGSEMSQRYGIASLAEAQAYLGHPVLGLRLKECVTAMCAHTDLSAVEILGDVDAAKFRSCLTLFALLADVDPVFTSALNRFFGGAGDHKTLDLLSALDLRR